MPITGDDGFDNSVPGANALSLASQILAFTEVEWVGPSDFLRPEGGLCLYGGVSATGKFIMEIKK